MSQVRSVGLSMKLPPDMPPHPDLIALVILFFAVAGAITQEMDWDPRLNWPFGILLILLYMLAPFFILIGFLYRKITGKSLEKDVMKWDNGAPAPGETTRILREEQEWRRKRGRL